MPGPMTVFVVDDVGAVHLDWAHEIAKLRNEDLVAVYLAVGAKITAKVPAQPASGAPRELHLSGGHQAAGDAGEDLARHLYMLSAQTGVSKIDLKAIGSKGTVDAAKEAADLHEGVTLKTTLYSPVTATTTPGRPSSPSPTNNPGPTLFGRLRAAAISFLVLYPSALFIRGLFIDDRTEYATDLVHQTLVPYLIVLALFAISIRLRWTWIENSLHIAILTSFIPPLFHFFTVGGALRINCPSGGWPATALTLPIRLGKSLSDWLHGLHPVAFWSGSMIATIFLFLSATRLLALTRGYRHESNE
ncbi:MAG: hypothetical protein QM662_15050 [Gordonia sp. (in: high G+C Gram-positive bacteria)]